jgi:protease IV
VVAEGRKLSTAEVDAMGGGRVWAAPDALELGLIDMYGGLEKSIEVAAELAGLENYRVQSLPKLEDPLTLLMKELSGQTGAWTDRQIRKELGPNYIHYRTLKNVQEMKGVQAIMPFEIDLY